jgi:L-xylulokinase
MRYLLGIDNGGTFSKAAIFDETGRQLAAAAERTEVVVRFDGWRERDMEELWQANVRAISRVLKLSGLRSEQIAGISFSGHGKGLYAVDEKGKPVGMGILSTDTRAWQYPQIWEKDGTAAKVYQRTCQCILSSQPPALLAWLKDHRPDEYHRIRYVFSVKDYIRFRMTGEAYGEYSDFSGGNLIDFAEKDYDRSLLELFGLPEIFDKLPPLRFSADICGRVTKETAALTGLAEDTIAAAGMFDVNACGIASGLIDEKHLCMIAGTWSINEFLARQPIQDGSVALNSFFCIPGYYLVEESSPTSAGNMEWFLQGLMQEEQKRLEKEHRSIYELANEWVASIQPEDSDLLYLPFLNGSPDNPRAMGSFIGLTMKHTKRHMLRAVYEGIVLCHVMHVKRLLRNCPRPERIQLSGGAANSPVWVQMFADALQLPVETVAGKELGALGAAMAAGICSGVYQNYEEAAQSCVHFTGITMPRTEFKNIYARKYRNFIRAADALQQVWDELEPGIVSKQ